MAEVFSGGANEPLARNQSTAPIAWVWSHTVSG